SIVGRGSHRFVKGGVGAESNVRRTKIGVTTVFRIPGLAGDGQIVVILIAGVLVEHFKAIAGAFAVDGILRSRNAWLVEGDGDDGVPSATTGVANGDRRIGGGLPFSVQREVHRVREDVFAVIGAEVQGYRASGV